MVSSAARQRNILSQIETYDFHTPEHYTFRANRGLERRKVQEIFDIKGEPQWMRDYRLRSCNSKEALVDPNHE